MLAASSVPTRAGGEVVDESGAEDPAEDRHRRAEARRQQQGEKLCFVADLGERDDARRDEKCLHNTLGLRPVKAGSSMPRAFVSVVDECALSNVLTSYPAPRFSSRARTQVQARWPKRCALIDRPIVCLEALTCLTVHAVHATDPCGSPLSAFARETS